MSRPLSILSPEQLGRLKFIRGTYLLVRGIGKVQTVHTLDTEHFCKLESFLSGKAPLSVLKEGMKVFIVPDGSISGADMTAVCKKLNLKVTTDITKADVVIGSEDLRSKNVKFKDHFPTVRMIYAEHLYYVSCKDHQHKAIMDYLQGTLKLKYEELPEITFNDVLLFAKRTIDTHYPPGINNFRSNDAYLVSDQMMAILYHALDRKIPVVNDSELFASLAKVTITKESFETLKSMYQSSDNKDIETANTILFNCDYPSSKFYIWLLYDNYRYHINKSKRLKMYDNFRTACSYLGKDERHFIETAARENILPEWYYKEYVDKAIQEALDRAEDPNDLIVAEIKSKYTYQEFLNYHQNVGREETVH